MAITCRIKGHVPGARVVSNRDLEFSRCDRCGADLVRRGDGPWSVPQGRRIVWPDDPVEESPAPAEPPPSHRDQQEKPISGAGSDFMEQESEDLYGWDDLPFRHPISANSFKKELSRSKSSSGFGRSGDVSSSARHNRARGR